MVAPDQRRRLSAIPVLALLLVAGCAPLDSLFVQQPASGGITGRLEFAGYQEPSSRPATGVVPSQRQILVYLEAVGSPTPHREVWPVREIAIRTGRQEPEIPLLNPRQPVRFRNLDSIYHELFTVDMHNSFRVRLGGREASELVRLSHPGFVRAFCKLHPRESFAFIVSDAQHFLLVDADSSFEIAGILPGSYRVRAAGVDAVSERVLVQVTAGQTVELNLRLAPRSVP